MVTSQRGVSQVKVDLRRRYDALKLHHPFERVEAAFAPADLHFLLTDTDSLKITYLVDHKDLPSGVRLRGWIAYGVIADHARLAAKAGYTPKTLDEAIDLTASIGSGKSRQGWLEILIKHPSTKKFLTACAAAGADGPWLEAAIKSGASLQLFHDLRKLEVPPRYLTERIVTRCPDAYLIREWFVAGISPWVSAQFIEAGLSAGDALAWLQAGFIPSEIIEFIAAKKSIEECKSKLPNVPYSKVFRRQGGSQFGIAGPYVERVWRAVQVLDAPSTYQSSMYSTARGATSFLDGGYASVSGYGFGSHSYTLVRGEVAMRFLCGRIGVRQPKAAAHDAISFDQAELEARFREWRSAQSGGASLKPWTS
jgi:hypothetical protein